MTKQADQAKEDLVAKVVAMINERVPAKRREDAEAFARHFFAGVPPVDLLDESPIYAYAFQGERFDCGSKLGYLKATVAHGLQHPDTGDAFRAYLGTVISG